MRSALFPPSTRVGCCRTKEPTVWGSLIARSIYPGRAHLRASSEREPQRDRLGKGVNEHAVDGGHLADEIEVERK